jgi:beta-lactamase class A
VRSRYHNVDRSTVGPRVGTLSRRSLLSASIAAIAMLARPNWAAAGVARTLDSVQSLQAAVDAAIAPGSAKFGVAIWHPASGAAVAVCQDSPMWAASLYKLVVMLEAYAQHAAGKFSFDEQLVVPVPDDPTLLEEEDGVAPGEIVSAEDALELMITLSDNGCALALLGRLGQDAVNACARSVGMAGTVVAFDSVTTASDVLRFYRLLLEGAAVDTQSSLEMLARLGRQTLNDRLPALLPPGTAVAHKTGNDDGVVNDAGVIFTPGGPIVVVTLAGEVTDEGLVSGIEAEIARLAYDFAAAWQAGRAAPWPTHASVALPSTPDEGIIPGQ